MVLDRCGRLAYRQHLRRNDVDFLPLQAAILSAHRDKPCGACHSRTQVLDSNRPELDLVGPGPGHVGRVSDPSESQSRISGIARGYSSQRSALGGETSSRRKRMSDDDDDEEEPKRKNRKRNKKHRRNGKKRRKNKKRRTRPIVYVENEEITTVVPTSDVLTDTAKCPCGGKRPSEGRKPVQFHLDDGGDREECETCDPELPAAGLERSDTDILMGILDLLGKIDASSPCSDEGELPFGGDTIAIIVDQEREEDKYSSTGPVEESWNFVVDLDEHVPIIVENESPERVFAGVVLTDREPDEEENFIDSDERDGNVRPVVEDDGVEDPEPRRRVDIVWPRDKRPANKDKWRNTKRGDAETRHEIEEGMAEVDEEGFTRRDGFVMAGVDTSDVNLLLEHDEADRTVRAEEDFHRSAEPSDLAVNEVEEESAPLGIDVTVIDSLEESEVSIPVGDEVESAVIGEEDEDGRQEEENMLFKKYGKKKSWDKYGSKKFKGSSKARNERKYEEENDEQSVEDRVIPHHEAREISSEDRLESQQIGSEEFLLRRPVVGATNSGGESPFPSDLSLTMHDSGSRDRSGEDSDSREYSVGDRARSYHNKMMPWMNRKL